MSLEIRGKQMDSEEGAAGEKIKRIFFKLEEYVDTLRQENANIIGERER